MNQLTKLLRKQIRSNRFLYEALSKVRGNLPAYLTKSKAYFQISHLLRLNEFESNRELVDKALEKRLAYVLSETLTFVPYYKDTLSGINPSGINEENSREVLRNFPYLNKRTIMENPELFINNRYKKDELFYGTSGGSTGQGVGIWRSRNEKQIEMAFFDYEWAKLGYRPDKSRIVRFGTEARKLDDEEPWEKRGNRLLISPYHLNRNWMESIYHRIVKFKPEFFHAYPSCLEEVAKFIIERNIPAYECKGLLLASEALTSRQHELFGKAFSAKLSVNYGLSEGTNLGFGEWDAHGFHYKLNRLYGYSENRQDEFGKHEIVGTSYWNTAMPLIRYQTQDFGRIENDMIRQLDGRNQEYLITKDNERIPGFSIKIDEFTWDYVDIYQIVQEERGNITIRIVPRHNFNNQIKEVLLDKQTERWGNFFNITIEVVDSIPRTKSGKYRLVVSDILK